MKVKIGNKIHDGEKEPVMVILTRQDKWNISHMLEHCAKYAEFPSGFSDKDIKKFMSVKRLVK
jgi:hypothetical protein